ncbi:MAG: TPM domain-containing protein [Haliscomenobacter sp.]|nr:TPM domain-containing protein [Haliscomenobacter sp.]
MNRPFFSTRLYCLLAISVFFFSTMSGQGNSKSFTVETVPNPKRSGTGYVSDPANFLNSGEIARINELIADLEDSTTAQVAVVILPSIGEENPKEFATALFNHWGIGQRATDNGLLVLVVMDQRRTEFETGYGLEGILPDALCYRIGMQELVPYFQQKQYGQGLIAAVQRFKSILENPESTEEIYADPGQNSAPSRDLWIFLWIYLILNLVFHVWALTYIFNVLNGKGELYDKYHALRKARNYLLLVFFPVPFILVFVWVGRKIHQLRFQPRFSKKTGAPMRLLSESEEDQYLEKGQVTEEEIGSADYDVWATESGDDLLILRYAKPFTRYSRCPNCKFVTYYQSETTTIRSATYSHSGLKELTYCCKNCNYTHTKSIVIPKLTASSSSSSGGFRSGGGGSSSSWGGGRSGGGGAGVSW